MRPWIMPTVIGVLALALGATGTFAVVQSQRVTDEREHAAELEDELDRLRDEVRTLEEELAAANEQPDPDPPDDDDDSGDDGDGGDGGLDLGGLLDGLAGGPAPGQECLTPDAGGMDGLFDGLFGGGGGSLPDDPDELVDVIADQVAELRELDWQEPVSADFIDTAELHERLDELLDEDLDREALEASERLLATLGAIPHDADLEQLQRDLLDDQVAGYYVPDTGELVVRVPDDGQLRSIDKVTLAHELDHALTDQVLGLPDRSEPPFDDDADAALAVLSVIEGDATLLMSLWALAELSLSDQLGMAMDPGVAAAQAAMDDIPHYLQRELLFPYTEGLDWVCQTYLDGGWPAVDAAYDDPPATSAEVLWGDPVEPATPPQLTAPDGFDELSTTTFGAAHLLWLLEAPGDDASRELDDPQSRAQAWAGGQATVWGRGAESSVGLALVDDGTGSTPLCATIEDWYAAAFPTATTSSDGAVTLFDGDEVSAALRCHGDEVALGLAPDVATAAGIVGG